MFDRWRDRAYTTLEAAGIAGIHVGSLRLIVHRHGGDGWSARFGGRRWFSPRDISVLRCALALGPAMPMATALIRALEHHRAAPPPAGALLVAAAGKVEPAGADEAAQAAVEKGALIVPLGRIAAETAMRCAEIYEN